MQIDIEKRVEKARQLHHSGCNCAQAVVLTYADLLPIGEEQARLAAAPFGRGLSGLREVCGCVSGMALVCGLMGNASQCKALAEHFRELNGDINCGRLLQQGKKPCTELVADATCILGEFLNETK